MTTPQRPQDRTATQGKPCRYYAIPQQLSYKATSKLGPLYGFGQAKMISSTDVISDSDDGLQPGMHAEIAVAWPRLPDGQIRLQLVLDEIITGSLDGMTEAHILAYDFRTCRLAEEVKIDCNRCDQLLAAYKH